MTIEDISAISFENKWMKERYVAYFQNGFGPAWIMLNDNNLPICAFGAAVLWDGVCEVWFNLIRKENTISIIRAAKRYMAEQGEKHNIRRFQATVKCNSVTANRLAQALGFKKETPEGMKKYNPDGSDAYMYSRMT